MTTNEWRVEQWEGEDYIITGFGIQHPSVFRRREADGIVAILKLATPLIQADAYRAGQEATMKWVSEECKRQTERLMTFNLERLAK